MTAGATLFAHVIPKFTNLKEQAATEALGYILSESEAARHGVEQLVNAGRAAIDRITQVRKEVRGEDGERVDLVGFDDNGSGRLLVELKFWAELTDKQPNTYLKRLPLHGPAVLLFVVPQTRVKFLWSEVRRRAAEKYLLAQAEEAGRSRSAVLDGSERRLMMASWPELLDSMASAARAAGDGRAESEIVQLRGLTERMDMEAFPPWVSDDLKTAFPRRILALMRLVDGAVARLEAAGLAKFPKKSQPYGGGYGWWVHLNGERVWFGLYWRQWAEHGDSPLWLWPEEQEARSLLRAHRDGPDSPDGEHFRIALPIGEEHDTVLNNVVAQLEQVGNLLSRAGADSGAPSP